MINDFVKGKARFDYPLAVRQGIQLHRMIDEFTDTHPVTAMAKEIFRPDYRLYSGPFVDVVYDHYLATDDQEFGKGELERFAANTYKMLEQQQSLMPDRFARMFPYMREQNWLLGYAERNGIRMSFNGLVRRATYLKESDWAYELFETHYQLLGDYYRQFWKDLRSFAQQQFQLRDQFENI